ncbi:serine/threonine-protein kinase [Streptomyces sp. NPDC050418]|uniref:serine/threonine-protein kinase n=1 Tax=Streptomyces sp. NPDC050418 TaxID=3365612 RepID=UPI0037B5FC90
MQVLRDQDPRQIGPYRLLGRLGSGGMGEVFLARSRGGRTVAVKVVRQELATQDAFRLRFRREVEAARKVGGDWTARVLDADTEADSPWIATAFVPGPGLDTIVEKEHGPLPEHTVLVMAARLAEALTAIHTAGLVHRDLKPSNVLLTLDGPRVIDFGIARHLALGTQLTATGYAVGSPGFMSPEQVRGETVGTASDVFGLGALLAYAATGRRPFGSSEIGPHAQMFRIVSEEPDLEGVDGTLLTLITDCLHKEPALRPSLPDILERTAEAAGAEGEWLPTGLVGLLGRAAVRLLDADVPEEDPARESGVRSDSARTEGVRADGDDADAATPEATPTATPAAPADPGTFALRPEQRPAPDAAEPALLASAALDSATPVPGAAPDHADTTSHPTPKRRRRLAVPLVAALVLAVTAGAFVLVPKLRGDDGGAGPDAGGPDASVSADPGRGKDKKSDGPSESPSPSKSSQGKDSPANNDKGKPSTGASESPDDAADDPGQVDPEEPDDGAGNGFPEGYAGSWENREAGDVWAFTVPDSPVGKTVTWSVDLGDDGTYCAYEAPVEEATESRMVLGKSTVTDNTGDETCTAGDRPYFDVVDLYQLTYYGTGINSGMYMERTG